MRVQGFLLIVFSVYVKEIKVQAIEKIKEKKSRHELRKRDDHRYVLQVIIMACLN